MSPINLRAERLHDGDGVEDNRQVFQRDRDRILYSTSWRRLGHVTQVVSPAEGIVFHNRLTHTLEVSQIGRRIAERLSSETNKPALDALGGLSPDVVETASLVHDLGHPPYGHTVETELNRLVSRYTHDGYEGNAQSFRIVTKLARRRLAFRGLNLTRASLNAVLKYPWLRAKKSENQYKYKKWGVYSTELEEFEWAREAHPYDDDKKSLEAEIMDWADDVAYAVHDVEDFYRAGLIPLERFIKGEPEVDRFAEFAEDQLKEELSISKDKIKTILLRTTEGSPAEKPYTGSDIQRAGLKAMSASLIADCVTQVSVQSRPVEHKPLLEVSQELREQIEILKQLTWYYVIDNRAIKTQQFGQRKVVRELFNIYFRASGSSDDDLRGILPESQLEQLHHTQDKEIRARIVADLISSMTEQQLLVTHKKLRGIELGSITDLV